MKITLFDTVRFVVATIVVCCMLVILRGYTETDSMKEHTVRMWIENGLISSVLVLVFIFIMNKIYKIQK